MTVTLTAMSAHTEVGDARSQHVWYAGRPDTLRVPPMTPNKLTLILLFSMVMAACSGGLNPNTPGPSTTSDVTATDSPGDTSTPTTSRATDRQFEEVACDDAPDEATIVCEAYDLIKERYVDEIDDTALAEAAADGLTLLDGADSDDLLVCVVPTDEFGDVCDEAAAAADDTAEAAEAMVVGLASHLDANSAYFDPTSLELIQEEQSGEIQGIGALVSPEDRTIPGESKQCAVVSETCEILIISTIQGSPAEQAGLMRNDQIVAVDGKDILGWTIDELTARVRGPSGTEVTLTIERE
ncbi:MAG TPA: PDZ domain-containing protein, partial [Acidimicrobiia bacterium]|nr:PDZ domain-containing protein [Acidimicrobiia bacterium]